MSSTGPGVLNILGLGVLNRTWGPQHFRARAGPKWTQVSGTRAGPKWTQVSGTRAGPKWDPGRAQVDPSGTRAGPKSTQVSGTWAGPKWTQVSAPPILKTWQSSSVRPPAFFFLQKVTPYFLNLAVVFSKASGVFLFPPKTPP